MVDRSIREKAWPQIYPPHTNGRRNVMTGVPDLCAMTTLTSTSKLLALPDHARVWTYKSATPFNLEQCALIMKRGSAFVNSWATHGTALMAAVEVLHDHFVVLAVDERQVAASGCSIDTSIQFVQELERELGLSLTDRMVVIYEKEDTVRSCRVPEIAQLLQSGELTADTMVFDDMVATKGDLRARFRMPLAQTWMARYL